MLTKKQLDSEVSYDSLSELMMRSGEIMYQVSERVVPGIPHESGYGNYTGWRTAYAALVDPFDLLDDELEWEGRLSL